jgi:hypothetical protein
VSRARFPDGLVRAIAKSKILGIRAGTKPHRVIGVWPVVVERRVFVRSWGVKPDGWYAAFRKDPYGVIAIDGDEIPVRAVRIRSERIMNEVDQAYAAKFNTPASAKYVKDLCSPKSRFTTTELVPLSAD